MHAVAAATALRLPPLPPLGRAALLVALARPLAHLSHEQMLHGADYPDVAEMSAAEEAAQRRYCAVWRAPAERLASSLPARQELLRQRLQRQQQHQHGYRTTR